MAKRLETSVTARDEYRPGRGKQHASCQTNQRNSCSKPRNCSAPPARNRFSLFRQRLKALIRSLMHAAGLVGKGLTGVRAAPEPRPDSL